MGCNPARAAQRPCDSSQRKPFMALFARATHGKTRRSQLLLAVTLAAVCQWGWRPALGAPSLVFTEFPAPGSLTAIAGRVDGLPLPVPAGCYKAALYMQIPGDSWWSKPTPGASVPVAADGSFRFAGWASFPSGDVDFAALTVQILSGDAVPASALGVPLPLQPAAGALLASRTAPRGSLPDAPASSTPAGGGAGATPASGGGGGATATPAGLTLSVTAPLPGTSDAITGQVTGAPRGSLVVVYVRLSDSRVWGPKPGLVSTYPVSPADGSFRLDGWVQLPADTTATTLEIVVLPPGGQAATSLGLTLVPKAGTLISVAAPRGTTVIAGGAGGNTGPPPAAAAADMAQNLPMGTATGPGGATLAVKVPPMGSGGPVTGQLAGVPIAGQRIAVYVQIAGGSIWGAKPAGSSTFAVAADGRFTIAQADWAASGAGDINSEAMMVVALPAGITVAPVLGTSALPDAIRSAALVVATVNRRGNGGGAGTAAADAAAGNRYPEEIAWPPADAGTTVRPAGGMIQWGG